MDVAELKNLKDPADLEVPVQALWHDAQGDWNRAHDLAQEANSRSGDWVHAYLHRKEGDVGNAGYWYARAGRAPAEIGVTLEQEWETIAAELLVSD